MTDFIIVYVTAPDIGAAKKIADRLLSKKTVVCANIFPVASRYLWQGKAVKARECVMIVKTIEENFERLKLEVKAMHPYEVPCIIKIKAEPNAAYAAWVQNELKQE
jgi:periplasmic divalent cation tolerance protein